MDESSFAITTSSSDVTCSTACANAAPSESVNYSAASNNTEIYSGNQDNVVEVEMTNGERMALPTLKALLRRQLEYYFSRENLSTDEYLQSQMDSDGFVAISTVAKFNQVRRLTDDHNLVVEVLRESAVVQVDEAGEKVRPNPRSGVLILREIPESTPIKELEELFSSENCPKFLRCEFAHNNSWYVLFESDDDTQKAYRYLREEAKTFNGKPVMARIKAKAVTSAPFTASYKNGVPTQETTDTYSAPNVSQQQQQQQPPPLQYTYNVSNDGYNNQQVCPPFYPPTMLQAWAPTTPACVDLGTVLSANGLSPQAAFRPLNNNTSRHNYTTRDRPIKTQNYDFLRSEQRYFGRGQQNSSYLQRQQLHHQAAASFPNIVNANNCTFDYMAYGTRSRNIHGFGVDMNFFTAPNLYYSKLPQIYSAQARHNPVLVPRSQMNLSSVNNQDQGYVSVSGQSGSMNYTKDSVVSGATAKSSDSQVKENWTPNQRQQRGKRWWKENGSNNSNKNASETANGTYNKASNETDSKPDSPKFDLETSSFPPLPGCLETDIVDVDVYESRLSDIVKGTVKPTTRDTKTQTSESALVCVTKDSSTITVGEAVIPTDGAFTPPASPDIGVIEAGSLHTDKENSQEVNEWDNVIDSTNDSVLCNASISMVSTEPDIPASFSVSNSPVFHTVSTNSIVNGSVVLTEPISSKLDAETVPSEIMEGKQTSTKLPKVKQLDSLPKGRSGDLPSPKNKSTPETKSKVDAFKDRSSAPPKHRTSFPNSKESSSSKERMVDIVPSNSKTIDNSIASKSLDAKDKFLQGHSKCRMTEATASKAKPLEIEPSLLFVNGHADSESTVSSEDEKPFRKLTYSEVAMRAKEKVEKIALELKEKERQEAIVRQHRQQDVPPPAARQATPRPGPPFKEFPKPRPIVEARPSPKEWRDRRKPARAISLPATGQ